jgi:hypothetical protein
MDKATLTALNKSIEKWEGMVVGDQEDQGVRNCALCALFWASGCAGCPVKKRTRLKGCLNTPYEAFDELCDIDGSDFADTAEKRRLAMAELRFLESLLPKPKKLPAKKPARK